MTPSYSVLITNTILTTWTGTETFVRDLALGLAARGHRPMVYCPSPGAIARQIEAAGVPVVADLAALPHAPDVIHGHHHAETVEAVLAHPGCPAIFVCHDRIADTDAPPLLERIGRYVAVDRNCLERLLVYGIDPARCAIVANAVDLERFAPRPPLPARPARALVFSNSAGRLWSIAPIAEACRLRGIALDVIGEGLGRESPEPERALGGYDVVFAKGRAALEALAVGAAVVCCDYPGLGPLVRLANVDSLREWNFGWRTLTDEHRADLVLARLDAYDRGDAARVRDAIRAAASLTSSLDAYLRIYESVIAAGMSGERPRRELAHYVESTLRTMRRIDDSPPELARPLDPARRDAIVIAIRDAPDHVASGSVFQVTVEVANPTPEPLRTLVFYPLALSYHWLDDASGDAVEYEGLRTPMAHLAAGAAARRWIQVRAPQRAGRHRLVVTLVYEHLAWFDEGGRCRAEAIVDVTDAPPAAP